MHSSTTRLCGCTCFCSLSCSDRGFAAVCDTSKRPQYSYTLHLQSRQPKQEQLQVRELTHHIHFESSQLFLQAGQAGQAAAAAVLDTINTSVGLLSFFEALGALRNAVQQAQQKQAMAGAMPASPKASGRRRDVSVCSSM